jgi:hypothetical protein
VVGGKTEFKMAANNPRKFKDRIAQLAQKQAEGTAQFQEVMREVAEVKKTQQIHPSLSNSHKSGGGGGFGPTVGQQQHRQPPPPPQQQQQHGVSSEGMMIPRHLSPVQLPPQPHYRSASFEFFFRAQTYLNAGSGITQSHVRKAGQRRKLPTERVEVLF